MENREFTLVARFDDGVTKHLVAINREIEGLHRRFGILAKSTAAFGKELSSVSAKARQLSKSLRDLRAEGKGALTGLNDSIIKVQDSLRGTQGSLRDLRDGFQATSADSAASVRGIADAFMDVVAAAGKATEAARGIGADVPLGGVKGNNGTRTDGTYTVQKGVAANLIASGVESIFGLALGAVRAVGSGVTGKIQEAISDEMDDIATAGGIFSMGKIYRVDWADSYNEAVEIQKEMDRRMAVLAAKLPGDTDQYVRNSKQVSDTVMKMTAEMGPEFLKVMQGFDASVKTSKDAFMRGTEELAKYATLTDEVNKKAAGGGMPFNMLVETLLGKEEIDVDALRRRYVAIGRNPLLSGALDCNIDELNAATARFQAMLRLLKEMYPVEVVKVMTRSVDGAYQGMKSALFGMQEGLFGLKREFEITLGDTGKKIKVSLYQVGRDIFGAFAAIITPILEVFPRIFDPFRKIGQSFSEIYAHAKNAAVVMERETSRYAFKGLSDAPFRAAIKTLSELARWMQGDLEKIGELDTLLNQKDLDIGKTLVAGFDALFTSKAMDEFGYAIGKSVGVMLSDLVKLAKGGMLADEQGLVSGFLRGWNDAEGGKAIGAMIGEAFKLTWKVLSGVFIAGLRNAPVETLAVTALATGIVPQVLGKALYGFVLRMLGWITARIGAAALIAAACNPVTPALVALVSGIGATVAGWLGATVPVLSGMVSGVAVLTSSIVGGFIAFLGQLGAVIAGALAKTALMLAPLVNPVTIAAAIVVAIGALVYAFKDQIRAGIEMVAGWVKGNLTGPLRDALLGVTTVWKGIVNVVVGSIDWLVGLVTQDKARMEAGGKAVSEGIQQFFSGWQAILGNLVGAIMQAGKALNGWVVRTLIDAAKGFFMGVAKGVQSAMSALNALQGNFVSTVGSAVMGLAKRIFSWVTGIQLPNTPPDANKNPTPGPTPSLNTTPAPLPLPQPISDALRLYNWLKPKAPQPTAAPNYDGAGKAMPLLDAIRTEMANKPTGSDLVIANSSETVIPAFDGWMPKALPAADGNGMGALANGLKKIFGTVGEGFRAVSSQYQQLAGGLNSYASATENAYAQSEETSAERYGNLRSQLGNYHRQTQQQFAVINGNLRDLASQVAAMSSMGGGLGGAFFGMGAGGGGVSKVVAVGKMLEGMGLNVAENPAFGSGRVGQHAPNSYHYSGRAIDVTGPTALLDEAYAKLKATNPSELLWRTAGHFDHLHVAYALGAGKPAFFSSVKEAQNWERAMVPGSAKVRTITGNSNEALGATTVNVGGVTVYAGDVRDPRELAAMVAVEIGNAVSDARAASLFV